MNQASELAPPYGATQDVQYEQAKATGTVFWGAILGGAAAAAAFSLILLILGTGLGLSVISPWGNHGIGAMTLGVSTILWLMFTQILASGLGGYLAGRLRNSWVDVHTDEVYFRDTAHGFLAWAIATLVTAAFLTTVVTSLASGGVQTASSLAKGVASLGAAAGTTMNTKGDAGLNSPQTDGALMTYVVDDLFRSGNTVTSPAAQAGDPSPATAVAPIAPKATGMAEVTHIWTIANRTGSLSMNDRHYIGQVVAAHSGLSQQDAEKRVSESYARFQATLLAAETAARDAADKARKASAYAALWLFVSLLSGAFFASWAATFGGRQRDR